MDLPGDDGGWDTQHTGQRFHPSCIAMFFLKKGYGKLPNTWVYRTFWQCRIMLCQCSSPAVVRTKNRSAT